MMFDCTFIFCRRVWDQWLTQISFKHKLQDMDRVALQFWADGLISKVQKKTVSLIICL